MGTREEIAKKANAEAIAERKRLDGEQRPLREAAAAGTRSTIAKAVDKRSPRGASLPLRRITVGCDVLANDIHIASAVTPSSAVEPTVAKTDGAETRPTSTPSPETPIAATIANNDDSGSH